MLPGAEASEPHKEVHETHKGRGRKRHAAVVLGWASRPRAGRGAGGGGRGKAVSLGEKHGTHTTGGEKRSSIVLARALACAGSVAVWDEMGRSSRKVQPGVRVGGGSVLGRC